MRTIKETAVLGASSIGGTFVSLWCFTWKTKKEREKWVKHCEEHYKGYFLKFEDRVYKF